MNDSNQIENYKEVLNHKLTNLSKLAHYTISNTKIANYVMVALTESYLLTPISKTFRYKRTNPKQWKLSRKAFKKIVNETKEQVLNK